MATKKDLVEAHAFSRRRLVTAFVSGAPGGREVEPARPGRTIVGGLALALLVVAAGAILAVLVGRTQEGWDQQTGLVTVKENSHIYAVLQTGQDGGTLDFRPVINPTSGQLIFGDKDRTVVSEKTIADVRPNSAIGIPGAPTELPTADQLIQTDWTSCVDDSLHLTSAINQDKAVRELQGQSFLVRDQTGAQLWLVAEATSPNAAVPVQTYRYLLDTKRAVDGMLGELGVTVHAVEAKRVSDSWLQLIPAGKPLDLSGFDTTALGQDVKGAGTGEIPTDAKVGDYVASDGGVAYVYTTGGVVELDPFAAAVYLHNLPLTGYQPKPLAVPDVGEGLSGGFVDADNLWPQTQVPSYVEPGRSTRCLDLDTSASGGPARIVMAADPSGDNQVNASQPLAPQRFVQPGHGALVLLAGSADQPQQVDVIDEDGNAYEVDEKQTLVNLGYDIAVPTVPAAWVKLFSQATSDPVVLSYSRALCAPSAPANQVCSS